MILPKTAPASYRYWESNETMVDQVSPDDDQKAKIESGRRTTKAKSLMSSRLLRLLPPLPLIVFGFRLDLLTFLTF